MEITIAIVVAATSAIGLIVQEALFKRYLPGFVEL
jgi:hypothetical protein